MLAHSCPTTCRGMHLHAQWKLVFNSQHSVTKMSPSEHQVLPEGVQRVQAALQAAGHPHTPVMLDGAARTAQEAADGLGVQLGQIAKSVIFKRKEDGVAVLVVELLRRGGLYAEMWARQARERDEALAAE